MWWDALPDATFFHRVINFSHFCSFMVVWGFGSWIEFWEKGLMGFGACGAGPSGFFWVGAPHINIEE